jgi:VIT1/CCC1 family predicted Fe2+/Mn2+ transporter
MIRIETLTRTAASLAGALVFAALFVGAAVPVLPIA